MFTQHIGYCILLPTIKSKNLHLNLVEESPSRQIKDRGVTRVAKKIQIDEKYAGIVYIAFP